MADSSTNKKQPNILWIGVDQMRADAPGCNGNPVCQTPYLDQLAREGVNFNRAYSPSSLCTPARASMLTGLYAFHHGMGTNCDMYHAIARELPRPEQLLHYRLQEFGYRCGFTGKWHVGTELGPADYGFEGLSVPGYGDLRMCLVYLLTRQLMAQRLDLGDVGHLVGGEVADLLPEGNRTKLFVLTNAPPIT